MTRAKDGIHQYCDHCQRGVTRLRKWNDELLCDRCLKTARKNHDEQRHHTDRAKHIEGMKP